MEEPVKAETRTHACGAEISAANKFCPRCGGKMNRDVRSANEIKIMRQQILEGTRRSMLEPVVMLSVSMVMTAALAWAEGEDIDLVDFLKPRPKI